MFNGIDLYSDTVTRPSSGMRKAMMEAEVGDEQKGEDPTTLRLEEQVADLVGTSAALFFPSATMANEVAIRLHCRPGDDVIAAEHSHVFFAEAGGPAVHAGVMAKPIITSSGVFDGEMIQHQYRSMKGPHYPVSRLVIVENTTNMGGGEAWPSEKLQSVIQTCRELNLAAHLDGSRIFNASVSRGTSVRELANGFNSVTLCLSKGLGCPAGAVLAFTRESYPEVRRLKQLMGGCLRQSGILAAAGLYALENNVERLVEDHQNAKHLAHLLASLPFLEVETRAPSSNMVYFQWKGKYCSAEAFLEKCTRQCVRFSLVGKNRFRAVTHLDISREDCDTAVRILEKVGDNN